MKKTLVPHIIAYEDIYDAIYEVSCNKVGHSDFRKAHIQCSNCYSNFSKEMHKNYTDSCHCSLDHKLHSEQESKSQ